MKKSILSAAMAALLGFATLSFVSPKGDVNLPVNLSKSSASWLGKKVTGEHSGAVTIKSGKLVTDGKSIKGGTFEIDMNSITCKDLTDAEWNGKLVGHLKSEDFFNVAKFPVATFVITSVAPKTDGTAQISGKLTIKGITKDLSFPAKVSSTPAGVTASANIVVDRTAYDIKYGSKSFFDSLGDKAIDNEFTLTVNLVAGK
jgi:polyisoprenoid-binding protein YceI